jgi:hypothetical protein
MSNIENDAFDAMRLNVIKLTRVSDCDIVLAEIKFTINQIDDDIANKRGDAEWERDAVIARNGFEHKGRMVALKRESLLAPDTNPKHSEEVLKAIKFKKAARVILDRETFDKVNAMACFTE